MKNENRVRMDRGIAGVEPDSALAAPLQHSRIRAAVDKAKRSLMIRTVAAVDTVQYMTYRLWLREWQREHRGCLLSLIRGFHPVDVYSWRMTTVLLPYWASLSISYLNTEIQ